MNKTNGPIGRLGSNPPPMTTYGYRLGLAIVTIWFWAWPVVGLHAQSPDRQPMMSPTLSPASSPAQTPPPAADAAADAPAVESAIQSAADQTEDPTLEKIKNALGGQSDDDVDDGTLLGGILGEIHQRGSILDGTSLDANPRAVLPPAVDQESRYLVAEQLLKASRLLLQVRPKERESLELVNQMRLTAVKLLIE